MKKNSKKDQKTFFEHMSKFFIQKGAKRVETNSLADRVTFEINTLGGLLEIYLHKEQDYTFTVFALFLDYERAKNLPTVSHWKYNIHSGIPLVSGAIDECEKHFLRVFLPSNIENEANELADHVCHQINKQNFTEQYGRQACLEAVIRILEQRV